LSALLSGTVDLLRKDPAYAGLDVVLAGEDTVVDGDIEQLQTVVLNLLLNSAQAVGGNGRIEVTLTRRDGWCDIRIRDYGPGISPEVRERVFEPFFTTKHRGTGLGLPTARRVVEMHHGTIALETPEDGGTVVTISLPARSSVDNPP
jgi:signal transduction histidine kinase